MADGQGHTTSRGRILVVCTGNVCRSPYIERRLTQSLAHVGVDVASAGTIAMVGSGMDPLSEIALRNVGGDPRGFTASDLTAQEVAGADLVLTATRTHRGHVARMHPRSMSYCFTLGDFRDLVDGLDHHAVGAPDPGTSWVAHVTRAAAARRGLVAPRAAEHADIVDPYGREEATFAQMAEQIERELPPIIAALTPPRWL